MVHTVNVIFWINDTELVQKEKKTPYAVTKLVGSLPGPLAMDRINTMMGFRGIVFTTEAGTVETQSMITGHKVLARGQSQPRGVAADLDQAVFWTNQATGEIMRLDADL
jgi:hypothetical protein